MGCVLIVNLLILGSTEIWIDRRSISGSGIVLDTWTSSRTRIAIQKCGPSMVLVYIAVSPIVVIAVGVAVAVASITLTCALTVAVALTVALTVALAVSVAVVSIAIAIDEDVSWKV